MTDIEARRAYARDWYAANYARPRPQLSDDERREAKRKRDTASRERRRLNPAYRDKIKAQKSAWNAANQDKVKEHRRTCEAKPERKAQRCRRRKQRLETDPQFAIAKRLRGRLTEAIRNHRVRKHNTAFELLGCSISEFLVYLEGRFLPGMTWDNRKLWHIDHVKPVCSFDLTDPAQQALCFHYTNMQPLWIKDNLEKGKKVVE